jgi:hypothetical protein
MTVQATSLWYTTNLHPEGPHDRGGGGYEDRGGGGSHEASEEASHEASHEASEALCTGCTSAILHFCKLKHLMPFIL